MSITFKVVKNVPSLAKINPLIDPNAVTFQFFV